MALVILWILMIDGCAQKGRLHKIDNKPKHGRHYI
jgi:hypothetical protein